MENTKSRVSSLNHFISRVFIWMFAGLFLTAITAFVTATNVSMTMAILTNRGLFFGLIIVELILVYSLSAKIHKLSVPAGIFLFMLYSFINGLTLSAIFIAYTLGTIYTAFFVSAGMFAAMAAFGYFTKKELSAWSSFLYAGLFGIIIAGLVNIFVHSSALDFLISVIGVIIFAGLAAFDMQMIKNSYFAGTDEVFQKKIAISCALKLYLDFINIFLYILRILGRARD